MNKKDILIGYRVLKPIPISENSPICNLLGDEETNDIRCYLYIPNTKEAKDIEDRVIEDNEDFEKHIKLLYHQDNSIHVVNGNGNIDLKKYIEIPIPLIFDEKDDIMSNEEINSYINSIINSI